MSERQWRLSLQDMAEAVGKVLRYIQGMTREQFFADSKTYDAVLRNLEILGEAAKNIPDAIKNKYPEIEWRKISGLRDIAIHRYFGINEDVLWDVLSIKLGALQEKIETMLPEVKNLDTPQEN